MTIQFRAATSSDIANQLEPLNVETQYAKIVANSMIDSGSVCIKITKTQKYHCKIWLI